MEEIKLLPHQKLCLTIEECAAYSMIGENRLRKIIENNDKLDWVIRIGSHTKIKRPQFERWIEKINYL